MLVYGIARRIARHVLLLIVQAVDRGQIVDFSLLPKNLFFSDLVQFVLEVFDRLLLVDALFFQILVTLLFSFPAPASGVTIFESATNFWVCFIEITLWMFGFVRGFILCCISHCSH